eukprot:TRINITY_DN24281_c0_g1_i1.p1 TRINITY_DN24281_c0_g1~~TRINITY_DN24281_c0_g1_i1.p1  ORF type:complete len:153 (-),score=36.65 TRINITY_DN24281_c0_g1_i1:12-470(-)
MMLHFASGKFGYELYNGITRVRREEVIKGPSTVGGPGGVDSLLIPELLRRVKSKKISYFTIILNELICSDNYKWKTYEVGTVGSSMTSKESAKESLKEDSCLMVVFSTMVLFWIPHGAAENQKESYRNLKDLSWWIGFEKREAQQMDEVVID